MVPVGLIVALCPAAPPTAVPPARVGRGDEWTYRGTVSESVDRVDVRYRRAHELEVRVFAFDRPAGYADLAVLTRLTRADDATTGAAVAVTGRPDRAPTPPAARLELVRLLDDGTTKLHTPAGPLPSVPLDRFSPCEFGPFPNRPAGPLAAGREWAEPDPDATRPPRTWAAGEPDFVDGERCLPVRMTQQSPLWAKPQGGRTAWEVVETAWLSTDDGTVRRVHRVVRQRDGTAADPAVVVETKYQLVDKTRLIGRTFDRTRRDIEAALAADPAPPTTDDASPYRTARRRTDTSPAVVRPPVAPVAVAPAGPPVVGQTAADFVATAAAGPGAVRLSDLRGRPAVLVFFQPDAPASDGTLQAADAVHRAYPGRVVVVPLAVGNPATAVRQRVRVRVAVPVYDGAAAGTRLAVETFPQFVVVDAAGRVAAVHDGYVKESAAVMRDEVERLLHPAKPDPAVTAYPVGRPPVARSSGP